MAELTPIVTPYSHIYQEQCFISWYSAGRPTLRAKIQDILPKDELGRVVDVHTFVRWRNQYSWDVRADELDARVITEAEDTVVRQKVLMLKEQAARARKMQMKGEEYLDEHGIDSSSAAVQAIFKGAELEQKTRGLSAKLLQVLEMDDDGLVSETQKLIERALQSGETIDVAEIPEEDEEENV